MFPRLAFIIIIGICFYASNAKAQSNDKDHLNCASVLFYNAVLKYNNGKEKEANSLSVKAYRFLELYNNTSEVTKEVEDKMEFYYEEHVAGNKRLIEKEYYRCNALYHELF